MLKGLFNTDYVIYDRANDYVIQFKLNVVIFGSREEVVQFRDRRIGEILEGLGE